MALAESVLRKINKSGLLPKIVQKLPMVSMVLALASIAWLLHLPMDGQYRHTYISENALMPGQVTSYFRESEWNYVRGFRSEASMWDFENMSQSNPELEHWLRDMEMKVSHYEDSKNNITTMYSLMHAPRGDNTEALVLVVPYFTSDRKRNVGGFSLAPALARYFARMSIWSKNIIMVFPRDSHSVLRSWVEAYHTTLDVTAGSIEAAITIEYASDIDNFNHMEIFYEGLNGQLPNLDLINTATTVARNEGIRIGIQDTSTGDLDKNNYWSRLRILSHGILRLAFSEANQKPYGCEAFSGWQIQAMTLKAVGVGGPDITQFGRVVDSTFRSVNNLLEKFHQSFFFYLLLSPYHFVSIGTYLPSAVIVAAAYFVSSLYSLASGVSTTDFIYNIKNILLLFTCVESLSLSGAIFLQNIAVESSPQDFNTRAIVLALITIQTVSSIGTFFRGSLPALFSRPLSHMLLSFSLYFIAMLIISLLIVHFTLALFIGLFAFPLTLIPPLLSRVDQGTLSKAKSDVKISVCLFFSCPFTVVLGLGYILDGGKIPGSLSLVNSLLKSWNEMQSWTWFVIALGWFPAWFTVAISCAFGNFTTSPKPKQE